MAQLAVFISNHLFLSLAFMAVLFLYIMMFLNEKMQNFSNVNTSELTQLVNHKDAVLIDTRSVDDYQKGHIVNAINIPLADMQPEKISKYKGKTVIAYCVSGMSSKTACKNLKNAGVEHVFNLTGGINSWLNEKLPLAKK